MCVCVCVCIFNWRIIAWHCCVGFFPTKCESAVASQRVRVMKKLPAKTGDGRDSGLIPGLGRSPGRGHVVYSSILVWGTPWTEEPGGLQSMGSQRVERDWSDLAISTRTESVLIIIVIRIRFKRSSSSKSHHKRPFQETGMPYWKPMR